MNLKSLPKSLRTTILLFLFVVGYTQVSGQYLLNESFDNNTFPPTGWTSFYGPGSPTSYYVWQQYPASYNYPSVTPHSGAGFAFGYNWGLYAYPNPWVWIDLATPALPLQNYTNGYALVSLWLYKNSGSYTNYTNSLVSDDKFSVYVNTAPNMNGSPTFLGTISPYQNPGTFYPPSAAVSGPGWYQYSFSIPNSYNNAPAYVIFQDSSNYGYDEDLDDVSVKWIAPCNGLPTASTITTAVLSQPLCSGNNMTITAVDPNTASSIYTYWQQSTTGAPGSWTTIASTYGPLNVSGGSGNSYTTPALVGTMYYRFADSCVPTASVIYTPTYTVPVNTYAVPYTENFSTTATTSLPVCFTNNVTNSGQSKWYAISNGSFHDATGAGYPSVVVEDDKAGNTSGKNAFFTLPALPLNAGETYRIKFGYERGRSDATGNNAGSTYTENLQLFENYAVKPSTAAQGSPGGTSLFNTSISTDGHNVATLTFTPTATGAYFFSWYSNVPHPSNSNGPIVAAAGGFIAVDSIKIDSLGCNPPLITFQPQNAAVCLGNTATLSVIATGYNLSYQWYKDGSPLSNGSQISGATSSTITINSTTGANAGSYKVYVTGTCGSSSTIQSSAVTLNISNYPTDSITTTTPTAFCAGGSVVLTAHTAAGNSYQWMQNGNLIPNAFGATYTANTTGSYQSIATNATGCAATSPAIPVTVLSATSVTISPSGPTTFCNGDSVTFTANGPNASIHYNWLKNGVSLSPADTTNVLKTKTSGIFTIQETGANNCTVQFPTPINVVVNGPAAAPALSASGPLSFCLGNFVTLKTPNVNQPGYTYQWYQNGNAIVGATDTTYPASASGVYKVSVSQNSCAISSITDTVNVDAPPTTVTSNGTIICSGNTITLSAPGGPGTLTYLWYKNGVSTGNTDQTYSTNTGGTFTVKVTDAFPCVATSSAVNVTVGAPPSAVILATGPATFCPGDSVHIKANVDPALSYTWLVSPTGAAGSYTALPTPSVDTNGHNDTERTFMTSGYYKVAEANGPCVDTSFAIHVVVAAVPTPTIIASGTTSLCPGGNVTLSTQTGTSLTYQWQKNGLAIPGAITSTYVANDAGAISVIVVNGTGCVGVATQTNITTNPYPIDTISIPGFVDSVCVGATVTLMAPSGPGYTYQWSLNNANISPTQGGTLQSYIAGTGGSYKVTVTSNAGCTATLPVAKTVTVLAVPLNNAFAASTTTFCSGSSVILNAVTGSGLSYQWQWSPTSGNFANIPNATGASYIADSMLHYRVIISNGVCNVSSNVIPITVNASPAVSITPTGSTSVCQGGSVILNASLLPGVSYQWKRNNANVGAGGTSPSYTASITGSYTVMASSNSCVSVSPAQQVTINALPKDTIVSTPAGVNVTCAGTPLTLKDAYGYTNFTYQWKLNGGDIPNNAHSITFAASDSGLYSVAVTDTNGCSSTSSSYAVGVRAIPDPAIVVNGSVLTTGTFITYKWYLNDVALPNTDMNSITATSSGKYKVTVTDSAGCTATSDEVQVHGVGVKNVNNNIDVKIYPNPATSVVHIEAPVKVNISVSGLDGKVILQGKNVTQVDLSQLANGVYMLTVYDENNTAIKVEKLVKVGL